MAKTFTFDLYFDYACPFVYGSAIWLDAVRRKSDYKLRINWKFFPLEQVNHPDGPDSRFYATPAAEKSKGILALRGGIAARNQSSAAFDAFSLAYLKMKHVEKQEHGRKSVILEAAQRAGLDMDRFAHDLEDPGVIELIGRDYEEARALGVFGTPTYVFADGTNSYLQLYPPPPDKDAVAFFDEFVLMTRKKPWFREFKRCYPPQ